MLCRRISTCGRHPYRPVICSSRSRLDNQAWRTRSFHTSYRVRNHYETLGVSSTASAEDIKKAYIRAAKKYHPDMNPSDKDAHAKFVKILQAYEVLKDPVKRAQYDRQLRGFSSAHHSYSRMHSDYGNSSAKFYRSSSYAYAHGHGPFGQRVHYTSSDYTTYSEFARERDRAYERYRQELEDLIKEQKEWEARTRKAESRFMWLVLIIFTIFYLVYIWFDSTSRPKYSIVVPVDEYGRPVGPITPSPINLNEYKSGDGKFDYLEEEFARRRAFYEGTAPPPRKNPNPNPPPPQPEQAPPAQAAAAAAAV